MSLTKCLGRSAAGVVVMAAALVVQPAVRAQPIAGPLCHGPTSATYERYFGFHATHWRQWPAGWPEYVAHDLPPSARVEEAECLPETGAPMPAPPNGGQMPKLENGEQLPAQMPLLSQHTTVPGAPRTPSIVIIPPSTGPLQDQVGATGPGSRQIILLPRTPGQSQGTATGTESGQARVLVLPRPPAPLPEGGMEGESNHGTIQYPLPMPVGPAVGPPVLAPPE
jgi:hypothetical protein